MIPDGVIGLDLLYAGLGAAVAGLTKGFAGFGGGMIMTPLLSLVWSPLEAVVVMMILEGVASAQLFPRAMRKAEWRLIGPLALLTCLFVPFGLWALLTVDPDIMRRLIGALVLAFAIVTIAGWRYTGPQHWGVIGPLGIASGVLMGATGLGGPPIVLFLLARPGDPDTGRAGLICYFSVTIVLMIGIFLWQGLIDATILWRCLLLAPMFWLVTWIGSRLYGVASARTFRRIALTLLVVAGSLALFR